MKKGGVIFDFNGTLFWDSEYHEFSWDEYLKKFDIQLSSEQKEKYIHGRNGKDTFELLFKRKMSIEEANQHIEEKEIIYRDECLKYEMKLAPGSESLLNYLRSKNIPMAIATAAGKSNVDFYVEKFNLLDYFKEEHIIYNDGSVKSKPNPDIFEKAIQQLGVEKANSIIFEDSFSGIQAALNCNVQSVIIVNSTGTSYDGFDLPIINHFDEFDREMLNSL